MKKILIVEDHDQARRMLALALERAGFKDQHTALARSALRIVRDKATDAVVLDVGLSDGPDGFALCEQIKSGASSKKIFVVMASGLSDPDSFDRARRAGANAFLVKPFRLSRLIEILSDNSKWGRPFFVDPQP